MMPAVNTQIANAAHPSQRAMAWALAVFFGLQATAARRWAGWTDTHPDTNHFPWNTNLADQAVGL